MYRTIATTAPARNHSATFGVAHVGQLFTASGALLMTCSATTLLLTVSVAMLPKDDFILNIPFPKKRTNPTPAAINIATGRILDNFFFKESILEVAGAIITNLLANL